jgi:chromate transporter
MLPDLDGDVSSGIIVSMAWYFATISLTAVGGGVIMLAPDVHRYVVDVRHWLTGEQFAAAFAIAQAAPGPNLLYVTLIGLQIAGIAGALAATAAIALPTFCVTLLFVRFTAQHAVSRFGTATKNGLAPISIGLLAAGGLVLAQAADIGKAEALLTLVSIGLAVMTRLNPVWLIALGALVGIGFGL